MVDRSEVARYWTKPYQMALASLMHTPIRFLPAAIREVAEQHERTVTTVEVDLRTYSRLEDTP